MTSDKETYRLSRQQEDALTNNRVTWLIVSQGLLFAGFGQIISATANDQLTPPTRKLITSVIAYVGIATCAAILVGLLAALGADFCYFLDARRKGTVDSWLKWGANSVTTIFGWLACISFPIIFAFAWWKVVNGI